MTEYSRNIDAKQRAAELADFRDASAKNTGSAGMHEDEIFRKHSGSRVLVVDDVELNLEIAQLLLHRVGLDADTALNGRQAVDKVRTTAYAAVLMDVQMPEMDGLAATRAIRQMPGRVGMPILAITANAFPEHRRQCFDAGMDDFITKPVDSDTLYAALGKWLARAGANGDAQSFERGETPKTDVAPPPVAAAIGSALNLRERLADVAGLDIDNGLGRVRGNESKYAQVLALFVRGHEPDLRKIPEALRHGELSVAEQLVHALKGTAGLIGATAVAGSAAALLTALQQKTARDELDKCCAELATRLGQLIDGLNKVKDSEPPVATAPLIDTARGAEVLRDLEAHLEAGDIAASTLARTENQLLRALLGDAATALLSAIDVFDFEGALVVLRAAKQEGKPLP